MKAILFISTLIFSANAFSATAITFNGLSWKTIDGSRESVQSTYADCGLVGKVCDSSGWRWPNQGEVITFIKDFYNIDFEPGNNFINVDTGKLFKFFTPDFVESGANALYTFSSDLIREVDGVVYYGGGGLTSVQEDTFVDYNPRFDGIYLSPANPQGRGYESLEDWYWSGVDLYPFSLIMVKGKYDPTIGLVPIPASLFMFAPALLGFIFLRRKAKTF